VKVLRISQEYLPQISGPIKQASSIAAGLSKLGHQNIILSSTEGLAHNNYAFEQLSDNIALHRYPITFTVMRYFFLKNFRKDLWTFDYDIIHAHSWRSQLADTAIQVGKRRGVPTVLHAHASAYAEYLATSNLHRAPYKVYDLLFKSRVPLAADAVVVSTNQEKDECLRYGVRPERIHVIPSGITPADYTRLQRSGPTATPQLRVLFVGRLARDRNVELALRALNIFRGADFDFTFRIVGPEEKRTQTSRGGYIDELKQLAIELGIGEKVEFVGVRKGNALLQEYANADVFVYPSLYENFGNTVLEAAGAGLPILATATGVARDLVQNGETGYIVSASDPSHLASRLETLANGVELRQKLGAAVMRRAHTEYDWSRIVHRYSELYTLLLKDTELSSVAV
jgi:glycosyltransferase involved in cell wall biosynthesis